MTKSASRKTRFATMITMFTVHRYRMHDLALLHACRMLHIYAVLPMCLSRAMRLLTGSNGKEFGLVRRQQSLKIAAGHLAGGLPGSPDRVFDSLP